jgi:hypothetical protein
VSRALEANTLHGGERRLSVRAVKAAGFAFIGAKRRALTEEAEGAGAEFSQEGYWEEVLWGKAKRVRLAIGCSIQIEAHSWC